MGSAERGTAINDSTNDSAALASTNGTTALTVKTTTPPTTLTTATPLPSLIGGMTNRGQPAGMVAAVRLPHDALGPTI